MTFDEAKARIVALARRHGGTITAKTIEADEVLASDPALVSLAARVLAGSADVVTFEDLSENREWFPYAGLTFSALR